ncbi:MAG: hypothetical protein GY847_34225 [Proteobacteria bacterium]|nr:hypothetical protein [Pseudomonadota bacterium]
MGMVFISIQSFLKKSFTENLGLKLIAAVIAAILCFFVLIQEEAERFIDVEVVPNLPEPITGLVLSSELPDRVRVRLRGPRSVVDSLNQGDIRPVEIDLQNMKEGVSHHFFAEDAFDIEPSLKFVRVIPESIQIRMEKLVSRRLPVRIRTYGKLKSGTRLAEDPVVSPSTVSVIGAASAMRGLDAVETEDIDIDGLDVGEHVHIVPVRSLDSVSIRRGEEIKVKLKVRWIPGQRMISGLLVQTRGTELSAECRPKEVAVALTGPQVALDKLDPGNVLPVVILADEQRNRLGIHRINVNVEGLPENIKVTSIVPSKVQVKLTMTGAVKSKKSPPE